MIFVSLIVRVQIFAILLQEREIESSSSNAKMRVKVNISIRHNFSFVRLSNRGYYLIVNIFVSLATNPFK